MGYFYNFFLISLGEIFARYYLGLGTPPLSIAHPSIEYLFKPNQDVHRFGNHFITNQYGMRSEPFSRKKNSNELRVMVFGDSVVNGGNLTDHANLATTILKDKLSKILDKNVVVGNISAGSWGPGNWLAYAQEYGFFDADIIILVISSHDYIDNPTFQPLDKNTHPTKKPISALIEGIKRYVPRYFSKMSKNQNITESNSVSVAKTEQFVNEDKEVKRGLNDLKKFLELAKNYSNTILVLQHYERSEIISGHPEVGNKLINQTCQKLGIVPISLEPYFRRSIEDGINPYRDNDEIHPNNVGQRLIADAILVKLNLKNSTFFEHSIHKKNKILSRENF
ncbi:MAG: SGNH/GDSL hydrolase family protein [Snowella sp.]|nr:SGNH/GDSL hydrolase family protein [Snowella sp.]